jgi:beta-galactosidase
VRSDEFRPLLPGQTVQVAGDLLGRVVGTLWSETAVATDAEVLARFTDGPAAGYAALTRARRGEGSAWYVSTELDADAVRAVVATMCDAAGVTAAVAATPGVEVVVRRGADTEYVFAMNHTEAPGRVEIGGTDLLTGQVNAGSTSVPAQGAVVLRQ